jgi:hypothetical protein
LPVLTPDQRRLHTLFSKQRGKGQKRPETRWRGDYFKPTQAGFRLTARAACDYTRKPEVKAAHTESIGLGASAGERGRCPRPAFLPRPIGVGQVEDCFGERFGSSFGEVVSSGRSSASTAASSSAAERERRAECRRLQPCRLC